jgi:hypothetical protein
MPDTASSWAGSTSDSDWRTRAGDRTRTGILTLEGSGPALGRHPRAVKRVTLQRPDALAGPTVRRGGIVSNERMVCFAENEAWSIAFALADAAELARDVVVFSSAARFEH